MPTDTKLDEKDLKHHLLNPELNSVYDEEQDAPITDDIFPDRSGFFTGHRIPLELFSKDTVQRLLAVSIILLTDCPCVGQTKAKSAKSPIFMKVGWFDPSMGGFAQPQYFCPGGHPNGRGSPPLIPNFQEKIISNTYSPISKSFIPFDFGVI